VPLVDYFDNFRQFFILYSDSECSKLGGTASGSCAQGFGVCCLFSKTCGDTTDRLKNMPKKDRTSFLH